MDPYKKKGGISVNDNIFAKTMVEMNWCEVENAAMQNALVLLPVGVIEEHGRHLPLGTDIYLAAAQAKHMAMEMEEQEVPCIIAPPLYQGICSVLTKHFPGSFTLKPDTLKNVIKENLECLEKAGFLNVVLVNSHGDPVHRKAITGALQEYNEEHSLQAKWLTFQCDLEMEGFNGDENCLIVLPDYLLQHLGTLEGSLEDEFDVHAGAFETANMLEAYPQLTNTLQAKREKATLLKGEQIGKWLGGSVEDKAIIPMGYVGSPAAYEHIHSTAEKYNREIAKEIIKYYKK